MHGFAAGETASLRCTGRRSLPFAASAAGAGSPSGGNYCAARRLLVLVRRGFLSVENARGSVVFSGLRLFPAFLRAARFYGSASSRFRVEKVFPVPECGTGKRMVCPCLEDYFVMASNILPSSSGVTDLLETFTQGRYRIHYLLFIESVEYPCWPPPCCRGWSGHTS